LDVEYEGTRYRGWQVQQNARSVAGELGQAIARAGGELREIGGSGRTDAGVHALGQVAHLRLRAEIDPYRLRLAVNDALPPDVHVRSIVRAGPAFHARHDAVRRSYLYQVSRRRTAFAKRFVWWIKDELDATAMGRAAAALAGRHDFRHFCERPSAQPSTVVVVDKVELVEADELILVRLTASHFLWKMARRIVGVLVRVGAGKLPADAVVAWLGGTAEPGESPAAWTAPPSGLFLERVEYPGEPPVGPLVPAFGLGGAALPSQPFAGRAERTPGARQPPGARHRRRA
jgi:tRNA pseudouridine38-40 synthase